MRFSTIINYEQNIQDSKVIRLEPITQQELDELEKILKQSEQAASGLFFHGASKDKPHNASTGESLPPAQTTRPPTRK